MSKSHFAYILFLLWVSVSLFAQSPAALKLEKGVYEHNNKFNYDQSITLIHQFLNNPNISAEDSYYANLYLSYTYKRLFDYTSTLKYLDVALSYGLATNKKDFFVANINCQKALALFDTQHYKEADSIMLLLAADNYQYLNEEYQSKIIMQEAYMQYLAKNYTSSAQIYNRAIDLMQKASPCDLPMIYGKKIQLYGATFQDNALYSAYNKGLHFADSCNIFKYKMYITEMMSNAYEERGDYKNAYLFLCKYDTLKQNYNEDEHLNKIYELDKKYQAEAKDYQLKAQQQQLYGLLAFLLLFGAAIVVVTFFYYSTKKQNNIITQQNTVNERLISILSHDIKDPLLGVRLLIKKLNPEDKSLQQVSISLEHQIVLINRMLNDLLQIRKVNAGIKQQEFSSDVSEIIQAVVKELEHDCKLKNIAVEVNLVPPPGSLPISPEKIRFIIHTLLNNAIKYSYSNSVIKIHTANNKLLIQDFGPGIAKEKIPILLKKPMPSQQGTNNELGNGMGLYLVGQTIQNTKIKVEFESNYTGTIAKVYTA